MIKKWLLEKAAGAALNKFILKIKCDREDVEEIISRNRAKTGKFYESSERGFDYFLYFYNLNENDRLRISRYIDSGKGQEAGSSETNPEPEPEPEQETEPEKEQSVLPEPAVIPSGEEPAVFTLTETPAETVPPPAAPAPEKTDSDSGLSDDLASEIGKALAGLFNDTVTSPPAAPLPEKKSEVYSSPPPAETPKLPEPPVVEPVISQPEAAAPSFPVRQEGSPAAAGTGTPRPVPQDGSPTAAGTGPVPPGTPAGLVKEDEKPAVKYDILEDAPPDYKTIKILYICKREDSQNIEKIRFYFQDILKTRNIKYFFKKVNTVFYETEADIKKLQFEPVMKDTDCLVLIGEKKLQDLAPSFKGLGKYFRVLDPQDIEKKYAYLNLVMEIIFRK